jgi:hypothetical protein
VPPRDPLFWDGVAWGWRWIIVLGHLTFSVFAFVRQNAPLLYSSYASFDDFLPFVWWAIWNLLAAVLLLALPPRVPFGLISTLFSGFLYFLMGSLFNLGSGLIYVAMLCHLFGLVVLALFARALWLYMVRVAWFQRRVMGRAQHGR